jgi:hypothetical protein
LAFERPIHRDSEARFTTNDDLVTPNQRFPRRREMSAMQGHPTDPEDIFFAQLEEEEEEDLDYEDDDDLDEDDDVDLDDEDDEDDEDWDEEDFDEYEEDEEEEEDDLMSRRPRRDDWD